MPLTGENGKQMVDGKGKLITIPAHHIFIKKALLISDEFTIVMAIKSMLETIRANITVKFDEPAVEVPILAHNAMKFDIKVIINPLMELIKEGCGYFNKSVIADSAMNLYQLTLAYKETKVVVNQRGYEGEVSKIVHYLFRDSYKLITTRVANIATTFCPDIPKIALNHDLLNVYITDHGFLTPNTA